MMCVIFKRKLTRNAVILHIETHSEVKPNKINRSDFISVSESKLKHLKNYVKSVLNYQLVNKMYILSV